MPSNPRSIRPSEMAPAIELLEKWLTAYQELAPVYHDKAQKNPAFSAQMNLCFINAEAFSKAIKILRGEEVSFP